MAPLLALGLERAPDQLLSADFMDFLENGHTGTRAALAVGESRPQSELKAECASSTAGRLHTSRTSRSAGTWHPIKSTCGVAQAIVEEDETPAAPTDYHDIYYETWPRESDAQLSGLQSFKSIKARIVASKRACVLLQEDRITPPAGAPTAQL